MEVRESFKKYIGIFLICLFLLSVIIYISNVKNVDDFEIIESRNLTGGDVLITYSDNGYEIIFSDRTYPLYTSAELYPNYRASYDKLESPVRFLNVLESGDSVIVETYQNIETSDLYNYLYFYNGELITQDYISIMVKYDTKYFDNMYAMNGELNGLQIFDLDTGEIVHKTFIHQGSIVEVGEGYICFDDDTFINLNSDDKKLERAWTYLENEIKDENELNEYKELDRENPWIFTFDECNESGDLVYNLNDYIDGVIEPVYVINITLE